MGLQNPPDLGSNPGVMLGEPRQRLGHNAQEDLPFTGLFIISLFLFQQNRVPATPSPSIQ
jgi:hypothetical protein